MIVRMNSNHTFRPRHDRGFIRSSGRALRPDESAIMPGSFRYDSIDCQGPSPTTPQCTTERAQNSSPSVHYEQFNHGVKQLLKKHEIPTRQVNHRGTTLYMSDLTSRQRPTGPATACKSKLCPALTICQRSHVVYLATCELCGSKYVGMTVRQLHAVQSTKMTRSLASRATGGNHLRVEMFRQVSMGLRW